MNSNSGVSITLSPNDTSGQGNGTTPFSRTYNNTVVTLTAPATAGGNNFQKWQRNGVDWVTTQPPTTTVTMDADYAMTAVYVSDTAPPLPDLMDAEIAGYNPPNAVQVRVGEQISFSCTVRNTGNVRYTFIVGLSVWETGTDIYDTDIIDTQREIALDPGEQRTVASWTHTFTTSQAGEWYYQFGLWKARPFVSANLLDKKPSPAKIITVAKFRIGDRVQVAQNLNVRQCPDTGCLEIVDPGYPGYAPSGTRGTIQDGPESADGYVWWEVEYDPGFTGWSVENGLERT